MSAPQNADLDANIQVAPLPDDFDIDTEIGTDAESSTASISSSILNYRVIHGRTYHAARHATEYFIPNDDKQQEAMDLSHHYLTVLAEGKLFFAPIPDDVKDVLDVGTGTGIWAIDFADQYPEARVTGTDLSPMQPTWTPANMSFEVDDASLPWTWAENRFDFIHIRYLIGAIQDYPALFKQAFDHTKPGGWLESCEMDVELRCDDGTADKSPAWRTWNELFIESGKKTGAVFTVVADDIQRKAAAAAGYTDIQMKTFKTPVGGWALDPKLAEVGRILQTVIETEIEGYTTYLWHNIMNWPAEEYQPWIQSMRKTLMDRRIHGYMIVRNVWAKKPEA